MKNIYFSMLVTLIYLQIQAQTPITITYTNYLLKGNDTMSKVSNIAELTDLIAAKTDAKWDLSNASYSNQYYVRHRDGVTIDDSPFSDSDFYDFGSYKISGNLKYNVKVYFKGSEEDFTILGEKIPVSQAIGIGSITYNPNDSLVFLAQNIKYTSPLKILEFPASTDSSWLTESESNTNFTISITPYGIINVPCRINSYRKYLNTVVGWGSMLLKTTNGQTSNWIPVLQVRQNNTSRDSFFMNGNPAPPTLLQAFGLKQGQIITQNKTEFFTFGNHIPVVTVEHKDGITEFIDIRTTNIPINTSTINNLNPLNQINIFPNPASKILNIVVSDNAITGISYTLSEISGKILLQGELKSEVNKGGYIIKIPDTIIPGYYFLSLKDNNNNKISRIVNLLP